MPTLIIIPKVLVYLSAPPRPTPAPAPTRRFHTTYASKQRTMSHVNRNTKRALSFLVTRTGHGARLLVYRLLVARQLLALQTCD